MTYPTPVTKAERKILEIIARGHPQRKVTLNYRGRCGQLNALEWDETRIGSGLNESEFGEGIAHLTSENLIDSGRQLPGMFARMRGEDVKYYFWATDAGRQFLIDNLE